MLLGRRVKLPDCGVEALIGSGQDDVNASTRLKPRPRAILGIAVVLAVLLTFAEAYDIMRA